MCIKADFLSGDFSLNVFNYNTNEVGEKLFKSSFSKWIRTPIQRPTRRVTRKSATVIDHMLTNTVLENKIQSGIIKTDSNHFPLLFIVLTTHETCSIGNTKFIKRDISVKILVL